jgi:centrosomal protein CEP70
MLRQRGLHPVSFLQPSDILRIQEVVVLDEMAAHSLQTSMFSLLVDCDKKQQIIEEWMQTAHGDRVTLKEEQERNYKLQQEIKELRRQTQTDRLRIEEMENSRLNELQRHGEEMQQMKSAMRAEESRYHQLELKCRRQEIAMSQLRDKQQKLIEMV